MLLSGGSRSFPGMNWLTLQLPPTVRSSGEILLGNTLKSTHSSTFSTLPTPPTVNSPTLQLPLTNGTTHPLFNFSVIGSSQRQGRLRRAPHQVKSWTGIFQINTDTD